MGGSPPAAVVRPEKETEQQKNIKKRKTNRETERERGEQDCREAPCGPIIWAALQVKLWLRASAL